MGLIKEKDFPRGGKKLAKPPSWKITGEKFNLKKSNLFRRNVRGKTKGSKRNNDNATVEEGIVDLKPKLVSKLTYKNLMEGMLILGCIKKVKPSFVVVALPGHIFGHVPITQVSEPYTRVLTLDKKSCHLEDMFSVGQHVVVKVIEKSESGVTLTLSPDQIHSHWTRAMIRVGTVMVGAVRSVEDHVYVIDIGIAGVRSFLKKKLSEKYEKEWNRGQPLGVGQVIRCVAQNVSTVSSTTTVELSAEPSHVELSETKFDELHGIDSVLPGSLTKVTVKKVLPRGLRVELPNTVVGFIYEDNLRHAWHLPSDYESGREYSARLLYVVPIVKLPYLSLKSEICSLKPSEKSPFDIISIGTTIKNAVVLTSSGFGLTLRLGDSQEPLRGYVSLRRCLGPKSIESDASAKDILNSKFPVGSKHKCRVLDFDYMDQMYICTVEKSLLKAKYVHPSQLSPGDIVTCIVNKVEKEAVVNILDNGRKTFAAYVDPRHLSDVVLSHPERKFVPGSEWKARVLSVNDVTIHLTLKQSLVNSEIPPLTSYNDIRPKVPYEGTVVHVSPQGLVVKFYGNVQGFLPKRYMVYSCKENLEQSVHIGQTIKCYVAFLNADAEELILSMTPDLQKRDKFKREVNVGTAYKVRVTSVSSDGLCVDTDTVSGIIPTLHLSDNVGLAKLLLNTYCQEDCFEAFCFNNKNPLEPVFTLKKSVISFFQDEKNKDLLEHGVSHLSVDQCIPCAVHSVSSKGISLSIPLPEMFDPVAIPLMDVVDEQPNEGEDLGITQHQSLYAKVVRIRESDNRIFLSTRLSRCFENDFQIGLDLLNHYLTDKARILDHLKKKGVPWASFHPGDRVTGTITELSDSEAVLKLDNGTVGKMQLCHFPFEKLSCGEKLDVVVLAVDVLHGHVNITANPKVLKIIASPQDGRVEDEVLLGSYLRADILLVTEDYILVTLRGRGRFQLAYTVIRSHVNHLFPDTSQYKIRDTCKVMLHSLDEGKILTVLKENIKEIEREKKRERKFLLRKAKKIKIEDIVKKEEEEKPESAEGSEAISVDCSNLEEHVKEEDISLESSANNQEESNKIKKQKNSKAKRKQNKFLKDNESAEGSEAISVDRSNLEEHVKEEDISLESNTNISASSQKESNKIKKQKNSKAKKKQNKFLKDNDVNNESDIEKSTSIDVGVENGNSGGELSALQNDKRTKMNKIDSGLSDGPEIKISSSKKKGKKRISDNDSIIERPSKKKKDDVIFCESSLKKDETSEQDSLPRLTVKSGFVWDPKPEHLRSVLGTKQPDESSSDDDDGDVLQNETHQQKKKKRLSLSEKRELERQEEERIREIELRLMDENRAPQTADDFDRLVLSSPNSSVHWIQYMAYHLQATEIEKARSIARRALKTISFREETEKLNVWVALLNLEILYGTKESLDSVFKEAIQYCDPLKVYLKMFQIYCDSQKKEEAEKLISLATKKFRESLEVWTQGASTYMKLGMLEKARILLDKSVHSLDKKHHVTVICKFAQLEQKFGSPERAQTLMEQVLTSYPKRVDVWSSYVDMLVKAEQLDLARQVLERAVVQKLPAHKMKTLFKKFLNFEEKYGTPEDVSKVRQMAVSYVEAASKIDFM